MKLGAACLAVLGLALAIWTVAVMSHAGFASKMEGKFGRIQYSNPPLNKEQVTALLGQPARIDHSETADQATNGDVYHYPAPNGDGEGRVVFVNNTVFKAEFVPGAKS